jgi:hypothetical protein
MRDILLADIQLQSRYLFNACYREKASLLVFPRERWFLNTGDQLVGIRRIYGYLDQTQFA